MYGDKWTETEDELMRRAYGYAPTRRIAETLARTESAVRSRAVALGISKRRRWWSREDEARLVESYRGTREDVRALAAELGRTEEAVKSRIKVLRRRGEIRTFMGSETI